MEQEFDMDQVFYLASGDIQRNVKDKIKHEQQFYTDHSWQRTRRLKNLIKRAYCKFISFAVGYEGSPFLTQRCSDKI